MQAFFIIDAVSYKRGKFCVLTPLVLFLAGHLNDPISRLSFACYFAGVRTGGTLANNRH
jgi:hypothetical protein